MRLVEITIMYQQRKTNSPPFVKVVHLVLITSNKMPSDKCNASGTNHFICQTEVYNLYKHKIHKHPPNLSSLWRHCPSDHKEFLLNCTQNQHKLHVKHVLLVVTCATLSLLCLGMELVTSHRTQWVGVGQPVTVQGLLLCGAFPDLLQTRGVPSGCISYSSRKGWEQILAG